MFVFSQKRSASQLQAWPLIEHLTGGGEAEQGRVGLLLPSLSLWQGWNKRFFRPFGTLDLEPEPFSWQVESVNWKIWVICQNWKPLPPLPPQPKKNELRVFRLAYRFPSNHRLKNPPAGGTVRMWCCSRSSSRPADLGGSSFFVWMLLNYCK